MKQHFAYIIIFVIVSVVGVSIQNSISKSNDTGQKTSTVGKTNMIETVRPQQYDFSDICPFFGKVESKKKVKVISLIKGRIISVDTVDEMPVKKGTLLFTLGGQQIDLHLAALGKKVDFLKKLVSLAEKNAAYQKKALTEKLAKKEDLNKSLNALTLVQSELKAAELEFRRFNNALYVRATIDGVFSRRSVSAGQEIEKGNQLAEVLKPKHLRVVASLFPETKTELKGKKVIIEMQNGNFISGNIVNVLSRRTPEGATVIWIEGSELNRKLFPGETVSGKMTLSVHRGKLAVSQRAIVKDEKEQAYVFLKTGDGYHKQLVVTGLTSNGRVEIIAGVKETDEVVIKGAYELFYRDFNKTYKVAD